MFKWSIQAEATAKAKPKDVWNIWVDVPSWPKWDHELEWSILDGPFKVGAEGKLKPKGWLASKFCLIRVEEGKGHSDITKMPGTKVIFNHSLISTDAAHVRIIHHVEVSGLLAPLLWLTMRRALKKGLPKAVQNLARMAEAKN